MSLKKQLVEWIKEKRIVSYREIEDQCNLGSYGRFRRMYKIATADRRLREVTEPGNKDFNPHIKKIEPDGYIAGYKWVEDAEKIQLNLQEHAEISN
jgi:hypothetical protein